MKSFIFCVSIIIIIGFVCSTYGDDCVAQTNKSCTECLDVKGCSYCKNNKECFVTPTNPLDAPCGPSDLQMTTCFADAQTLAIILGSVGGVLVIIIIIFICCLCRKCKQRELRSLDRTQVKNERRLEERQNAAAIRSAERSEKQDQIRIKYGLPAGKDSTVGYRRMS